MSIPATSGKINSSIPTTELHMRMDTINAAAKAYYHAPSPYIRQEILIVIKFALPEGFIRYTTENGLIVERIEDHITIKPEKTSESGLCPHCQGDLLRAEIVRAEKTSRWIETTVLCSCGKFVRVVEKRSI